MRRSIFEVVMNQRSSRNAHDSRRLVGFTTLATLALTLCSAAQSFAQAEPEPAAPPPPTPSEANVSQAAPSSSAPQAETYPEQRPLPPPPPRAAATSGGTGYDPQANYNSGYPRNYYPPAPPSGNYRPFSFGFGFGPGVLVLKSDKPKFSAGGVGYSVRFGFGVKPDLSITLGFDGATSQKDGFEYSQTALMLGVQYFITQVIYLRAGMGVANDTEQDDFGAIVVDQDGFAFQGGAGVDLIQASSLSLALEAGMLVGHYAGETGSSGDTWTSLGLNLVFSLY